MRLVVLIGAMLFVLAKPTPAYAFFSEFWGYIKQYRLGIDYTNSIDRVGVNYRTKNDGYFPSGCEVDPKDATYKDCKVNVNAGATNGFGLLLQQPFRRKGLLYYDANIGFGARYLHGVLSSSEVSKAGPPLETLDFRLAAMV